MGKSQAPGSARDPRRANPRAPPQGAPEVIGGHGIGAWDHQGKNYVKMIGLSG